MAGPWFVVHRSGDDWQTMGQVWISDGRHDVKGHLEVKLELEEAERAPN